MKRSDIIVIIITGLTAVALIIFFMNLNRKPHFNWYPNYRAASDEPYGASILSELLTNYFPDEDLDIATTDIMQKLNSREGGHKVYLFIGEYPFYNDSALYALSDFVADGNDALLSIDQIPLELSKKIIQGEEGLYGQVDTTYYIDNFGDTNFMMQPVFADDKTSLGEFISPGITMNFRAPEFRSNAGYRFVYHYKEDPEDFTWNHFLPDYLKTAPDAEQLGTLESAFLCNFIKVPYGNGNFYFHTNPIVFTNLFMLQEDKVEYASKILSYLEPGDIIWDQYSFSVKPEDPNNDNQGEGPLKYILSQTSLRWAWYTILAGMAIFLLFRTKRMQQSIPVMEPNENKSLEFVQTIGRMYFIRRQHHHLVVQKMKLFQHFIQERYQLHAQVQDQAFMQKLHMKSEIPLADIEALYELARSLEAKSTVKDEDLITLHNTLDHFYKHCK